MKLGIVVVYWVSERNEKLLDLHLSQIEKNTRVPYTIYGSANRLLPKFRQKFEQNAKIKICDCPTTDLRGGEEHSYYLEHLVRAAIEDGATHVAVLHVDSFPVRADWVEKLAGKLSDTCAFAATMRGSFFGTEDWKPLSACIFFHRDFYLKYHPTFLLSESALTSPEYQRYWREFTHLAETGVGYGFRAFQAGRTWYPLERSTKVKDHPAYGHIYGDLIFHLGEAAWRPYYWGNQSLNPKNPLSRFGVALFSYRVKEIVKAITPVRWRRFLSASAQQISAPMYEHVRQQLLDHPEAYLNYLQTGKR